LSARKIILQMKPHKQVHLARHVLDQNYDTPITIDDLSHEVALSPYYLIRSFQRVYNETPHQYLIKLRMDKAKELLRNSDLSITEICMAVGYESLGSFSTLFRKVAGISPSVYRASSHPTQTPTYIPFCVSFRHGLEEQPTPSK